MMRALFLHLHTIVSNRFLARLTVDLQKRAFSQLIEADYARLTRERTGTLVSRLTNDIAYVQLGCAVTLNTLLRDTLTAIACFATMFYHDYVGLPGPRDLAAGRLADHRTQPPPEARSPSKLKANSAR